MKFSFFSYSVAVLLFGYTMFLSTSFKNAPDRLTNKQQVRLRKQGSAAIKNARDFLYWYRDNLHKANSYPLLTKDSSGYYQVDMPACKEYLAFLKSSELLSTQYFSYWQVFFNDASVSIAADRNTDQLPEGFDMDLVLITQEPELVLNKIDSLHFKVVSMNDSVTLLSVKLPSDPSVDYEFEMYKNRYSWRIGYISTPNYD